MEARKVIEEVVADMRKLARDYAQHDREEGEFAVAYSGDVADELRGFANRLKVALRMMEGGGK